MNYLVAYNTNVGRRKKTNQDSLLIKRAIYQGRQILFMVICDGMGGLEKGEVASASVIWKFSKWFEEEFPAFLEEKDREYKVFNSWNLLLQRINKKIEEYGRNHKIQLGTTATAVLFLDNEYYIVHVGDCRFYELESTIIQLTKDQTLVAQEVEKGILTEEEAEKDVRRSILLQCIGASEFVQASYLKGKIKEGAVYLLCCDGFRHEISKAELYRYFHPKKMKTEEKIGKICRSLTELNMKRGEQDNISVIAVKTR